jgi:DNA-binding MarR family transcriptional regulator
MSPTTEPVPLSADEEAFLRALGRVIQVLPRVVDADLMRERNLGMSEYMTLMYLSEAPDRRLRMSELAATCSLSVSGMTRIVSRLEHQGFVVRERCEADARGYNAVLTDAGLAHLEAAWPTHLATVRQHVFAHLDGVDLKQITRALQNFAT